MFAHGSRRKERRKRLFGKLPEVAVRMIWRNFAFVEKREPGLRSRVPGNFGKFPYENVQKRRERRASRKPHDHPVLEEFRMAEERIAKPRVRSFGERFRVGIEKSVHIGRLEAVT